MCFVTIVLMTPALGEIRGLFSHEVTNLNKNAGSGSEAGPQERTRSSDEMQ